jgi:hypothetical protein
MSGKVTMTELATIWSFEDLINFNLLFDLQKEIEAESINGNST